jgi:flagellar biosynthesis anti-sigma factor FlgM
MAIEIKNGERIHNLFKTTPINTLGNDGKSDFSLSLSGVQPTERVTSVPPVNRTDSVVITSTVTQIRKSIESSSSQSSVDIERLMQIKTAIENGTYEINPDQIAAKIIQFEFPTRES